MLWCMFPEWQYTTTSQATSSPPASRPRDTRPTGQQQHRLGSSVFLEEASQLTSLRVQPHTSWNRTAARSRNAARPRTWLYKKHTLVLRDVPGCMWISGSGGQQGEKVGLRHTSVFTRFLPRTQSGILLCTTELMPSARR